MLKLCGWGKGRGDFPGGVYTFHCIYTVFEWCVCLRANGCMRLFCFRFFFVSFLLFSMRIYFVWIQLSIRVCAEEKHE